jgi:hypothetical protein
MPQSNGLARDHDLGSELTAERVGPASLEVGRERTRHG